MPSLEFSNPLPAGTAGLTSSINRNLLLKPNSIPGGSMGHHHEHTRRDFFRRCFASVLAGASVFEEAFLRAGWARAQAQTASASLFTIEKVAEGVFAALAKPQ